ncbi:MAG TPA: asparagine synthetase B, partial [Nitrospiria bacterium]|nr:asparagine synthetase B [Candidatus Manganitrophaceae bacterium]
TGVASPFEGSDVQAIEALDGLLRDAVGVRMVSDVPLGAFLSGGYDSSLVVAQMQAQSSRPVKTFSIGFHEKQYNEANHAKAVAAHLKTDHTELYVTSKEAMDVIPRLPSLYDEPFSDSSQIPTFLVSQLARQHVTVSLSGDGGDELFSGYNRYTWGRSIWNTIGWLPIRVRKLMHSALKAVSPQNWDRVFENLGSILPSNLKQRMPGDRLHKLAEILTAQSPDAMYHALISHWKDPASMILGAKEPKTALSDRSLWANLGDFSQRMMYLDTVSYLPDDILAKVDRASMGVSLEARIPLLDHRIAEFAWRLPLSMKLRDGQGKWILRQVLYKYIPRKLVDRPKMGFGVPIDTWLRGPLREWAEELLEEGRLRREGFLNPQPIRLKWTEHLSGKRNWQYHLWDVLMFQAWLESQ